MSIKVRVDSGGLARRAEQAAERAVAIVMGELGAAFQQSFTAKAWDWPRDLPTRKLKGATLAEKIASYQAGDGVRAGNPRNLIDTGLAGLRGAYSMEMLGKYRAKFTWSKDYATAVHEGASIFPWGNRQARRVILPARPWTRAVLGQEQVGAIKPFPFDKRLKDVWLAKFKAG
jgi:hypothetical protein